MYRMPPIMETFLALFYFKKSHRKMANIPPFFLVLIFYLVFNKSQTLYSFISLDMLNFLMNICHQQSLNAPKFEKHLFFVQIGLVVFSE